MEPLKTKIRTELELEFIWLNFLFLRTKKYLGRVNDYYKVVWLGVIFFYKHF